MRILAIALLLAAPLLAEETWGQWLMRVTGLSVTSRGLRGDEKLAGEVWVAKLSPAVRTPWATDGTYRSPIFTPDGQAVLAIRDGRIIRIPSAGGAPEDLGVEAGEARLIAFHRENPDLVVILKRQPAELGLINLTKATYTPAPVEQESLQNLWNWASERDDLRLFQGRFDGSPDLNVFLQRGDAERRNISRCKDADCGQPSLSPDGQQVVYVKRQK